MIGVTQICRGFTDVQWRKLRPRIEAGDAAAWACAVEVFERRMRERFLNPIELLIAQDPRARVDSIADAPPDCSTLPDDGGTPVTVPGFAIMALCCLLIETVQSFRQAPEQPVKVSGPCTYPIGLCIRPPPSTIGLFREFLRLPAFGGAFDDESVVTSFVNGVRNGILHEAETRKWVIRREDPPGKIVEQRGSQFVLNRTGFCRALDDEFRRYLDELRAPAQGDVRRRFIKKMNDVAKEC